MADDGFYEIYDAHHDGVRRFIQATLRDPWAADDLVQETFLRVIRKRDTLKEPSKLRPWIYSIAFNLCRDHLRRRASVPRPAQAHPEPVPLLDQIPAPSSTEAALAGHQMNVCVQHKITLLPESQRTVLWLFDMDGMSQQEIAEVLGISTDNVKVRLHRARKRLKQILQTHCTFERDERDVLVCEPVGPPAA
ncbi:MAG: RNA polymerase sigma factor [Desulfobacterales bacterium]|nr:RNA polymerase sigma factor [Desulfobacterales bacterium]